MLVLLSKMDCKLLYVVILYKDIKYTFVDRHMYTRYVITFFIFNANLVFVLPGDLRTDGNPNFQREYHRAMAVVCDDLFFARFRRNTAGTIKNEPSIDSALTLLQQMFGNCHTEDEKIKMVDDLLDVKLLPATNLEGVHFNADRLRERYYCCSLSEAVFVTFDLFILHPF